LDIKVLEKQHKPNTFINETTFIIAVRRLGTCACAHVLTQQEDSLRQEPF
jgi:hypothetical protein